MPLWAQIYAFSIFTPPLPIFEIAHSGHPFPKFLILSWSFLYKSEQ